MKTYKTSLGKVSITVDKNYWYINKDYDKLTVVERQGNFGTYISRKPVPAGTSLDDRNYWIPFSSLKEEILIDYNSFVNKYKYIIDNHTDAIDGIMVTLGEINEAFNLIGDYIQETVNEAVAKLVADAPESFDTLKEIADWLSEHETDAISMSNSIQTNKENIETLLNFKTQIEQLAITKDKLYKRVTYNNLKELRDNSNLIPGAYYRIIDYDCTTTQKDTISAHHNFDIIVKAITTWTLSEIASATDNSDNDYYDPCAIESWKIWYCLDNDTERFHWADPDGKGVIYRMIDEFGNDCPYDFKNIMFKRCACTIKTIKYADKNAIYFIDGSHPAKSIYYAIYHPFAVTEKHEGNNIQIVETEYDYYYTFNVTDEEGNNHDVTSIGNAFHKLYESYKPYNNKINAIYDIIEKDSYSYQTQILNNIVFSNVALQPDPVEYYVRSIVDTPCVIHDNIINNSRNCTFTTKCYNNNISNCNLIYCVDAIINSTISNCDELLVAEINSSKLHNVGGVLNYSYGSTVTDIGISIFSISHTTIKGRYYISSDSVESFRTIIDESLYSRLDVYFHEFYDCNINTYGDFEITEGEYSIEDSMYYGCYIYDNYIKCFYK